MLFCCLSYPVICFYGQGICIGNDNGNGTYLPKWVIFESLFCVSELYMVDNWDWLIAAWFPSFVLAVPIGVLILVGASIIATRIAPFKEHSSNPLKNFEGNN